MQRRNFLALAGAGMKAAAILSSWIPTSEAWGATMSNGKSGFAAVNGLQMYYEIQGEGEPLILLHGGGRPLRRGAIRTAA